MSDTQQNRFRIQSSDGSVKMNQDIADTSVRTLQSIDIVDSFLIQIVIGHHINQNTGFYGISVFGLAERLNVDRKEAKALIDGYFETYPHVREYMDKSIRSAREKGYIETIFKRKRYLPDINSHNAVVRGYAERNAINAPIQGSAADIIKVAMVRIYQRFMKEGIRSKMILQVHDELNFSVLPEEKEKVKQIVISEMESAYKMKVPLRADCGWGKNWLEAH